MPVKFLRPDADPVVENTWQKYSDKIIEFVKQGKGRAFFRDHFNITFKQGDALANRATRYIARLSTGANIPIQEPPPEINKDSIKTVDTEEGQEVTFETKRRITSLDDLVDMMKIDLTQWFIERVVCNAWEVGAKNPEGRLVTETIYQVKATLVRKFFANIAPARPLPPCGSKARNIKKPSKKKSDNIETAIFIPDPQMGYRWTEGYRYLEPFHDRRAMDAVWQFVEHFQPDHIYILGDMFDFTTWNPKFAHKKNHRFSGTTQPAIEEGYLWLNRLCASAEGARKKFIFGNHEIRLRKFLIDVHSELTEIRPAQSKKPTFDIDQLLHLEQLGIETNCDYDTIDWLWDKVAVRHGEQYANLSANKLFYSQVQGHIHDIVYNAKTVQTPSGERKLVTMMSPGCLCRLNGIVPATTKNVDWQHGVGIGFFDKSKDQEYLHPIPIMNGKLFYGANLFEGRPDHIIAKDMAKATGIHQFVEPQ